MTLVVLSGQHVHELLPYDQCADVIRRALADLASGAIQQPLRTMVRPEGAAGVLALMPAYARGTAYGLKAICVTPGNPAIEDLAAASYVYEKATRLGVGTVTEF